MPTTETLTRIEKIGFILDRAREASGEDNEELLGEAFDKLESSSEELIDLLKTLIDENKVIRG